VNVTMPKKTVSKSGVKLATPSAPSIPHVTPPVTPHGRVALLDFGLCKVGLWASLIVEADGRLSVVCVSLIVEADGRLSVVCVSLIVEADGRLSVVCVFILNQMYLHHLHHIHRIQHCDGSHTVHSTQYTIPSAR
jgi:hypothetical protein